jgi:hypothetical protein
VYKYKDLMVFEDGHKTDAETLDRKPYSQKSEFYL